MKYSKYFGAKRRRFIKSKSVLAQKGAIHLLNENIRYDTLTLLHKCSFLSKQKKTLLLPRVYKLSITFSKWLQAFYPIRHFSNGQRHCSTAISHISKNPNLLQNISRPLNNSFFPYYWSTLML